MFFHPKDVGHPWCAFCSSHENDSEGCRLVIRKDGSRCGRLELLETIAHHEKYRYYPNIDFPDTAGQPYIYVTPYKHAVYGTNYAKDFWDRLYLSDGQVFPSKGGAGIKYLYGRHAEQPKSHTGINYCYYNLIDMESTIWSNRFAYNLAYGEISSFTSGTWELVEYFDRETKEYTRYCSATDMPRFGSQFYGDNYTEPWSGLNVACAPWHYDFEPTGVWFIDPFVWYFDLDYYCHLPNGESYVYNPFQNSPSMPPPPPYEPPPDEPPPSEPPPLPQTYIISFNALNPSIAADKVVWYWDSKHSFAKNEHSLANWLEGKPIGARIDSSGSLEIEVSNSNFPNVITSPDLNFLGESFNALRIIYLNLMEFCPEEKPKGGIGWVDEGMAEAFEQEESKGKKEGYYITFPLKFGIWQEDIIKLKGLKYWNWKKNVRVSRLLFTPAYASTTAQGKFMISSIELIKFKD